MCQRTLVRETAAPPPPVLSGPCFCAIKERNGKISPRSDKLSRKSCRTHCDSSRNGDWCERKLGWNLFTKVIEHRNFLLKHVVLASSPQLFFDTNPVWHWINCIDKDVKSIEKELWKSLTVAMKAPLQHHCHQSGIEETVVYKSLYRDRPKSGIRCTLIRVCIILSLYESSLFCLGTIRYTHYSTPTWFFVNVFAVDESIQAVVHNVWFMKLHSHLYVGCL